MNKKLLSIMILILFSGVLAVAGDVQVNVKQELGSNLNGATVNIKCDGGVYTDIGSTTDANGNTTAAAPPGGANCANGENISIQVIMAGYVTKESINITVYDNTKDPQGIAFTGVQFSHAITITDELGAAFIGATVTGGSTNVSCTASSNIYYCPVAIGNDGTADDIRVYKSGYVNITGSTKDRTLATDPQNTSTISGVKYGLKVLLSDELGSALTPANLDTLQFNSADEGTISGNAAYWAVADGVAHSLSVKEAGYVNGEVTNNGGITAITTSTSAQTIVNMSGQTACTSGIGTGTTQCAGLLFAQKVNVTDELGNQLTAATVTGGSQNVSCTENGNFYYCPVAAADDGTAGDIRIYKDGYVNKTGDTGARTDGTSAQATPTVSGVLFGLKVIVNDEIGTTGITVLDTKTYNGVAADYSNSNSFYWAQPHGAHALVLRKNGFVNSDTTNAGFSSVTTASGAQVVITMDSSAACAGAISTTSSCKGLLYTVKVVNVTNELGDLLTIDGSDVSISGSGSAVYNGGYGYLPSTAASTVTASMAGYVSRVSASVTPSATAQKTVEFDTVAGSSDYTENGLLFPLKVLVDDELSTGTLTAAGIGAGLTFDSKSPRNTSGNVAYFNYTLASKTLVVNMDGYVAGASTNAAFSDVTIGTTSQTIVNMSGSTPCAGTITEGQTKQCSGLLFGHKVIATDELGTALSGATSVTAGSSNTACTENASTGIYFCPVPVAEDNSQDIVATKSGYVTTTNSSATQDRTVPGDAQKTEYVSSVDFGQKLTITNELGTALSGATSVTAGSSNTVCTENASTGVYFCPVPYDEDGVANDITITETGYVTHTAGDTVARGTAATAQGAVTISDVQYAHKITVTDELGSALTGATVTAGSANTVCTENASTGVYFCAIPFGQDNAANVLVYKDGFVNKTGDTSNRGTADAAQGDNNVATVLYSLKVIVKDELNGTTGMDSLNTNTYNGVTPDATSTNTYYWNQTHGAHALVIRKNGYVNSDTTNAGFSSVTTASGAQVVITMDSSAACGAGISATTSCKGPVFAQKVNITDELGNQLTAATVTGGSQNVSCTENGNFYYCPVAAADDGTAGDIRIYKDGYVNKTGDTGARTDGTSAQATPTVSGVLFGLKVIVNDEIGSALTPANLDTLQFNTVDENGVSGNAAYWAQAHGTHSLSVQEAGYVNGESTNTGGITAITTSDAAQVVVNMSGQTACTSAISGAGPHQCAGLLYTIRVVNVTDELGNQLTVDGTDVTIEGSGTTVYNGGDAYLPSTAAAIINASMPGFVNVSTVSVTPSATAQKTVGFDLNADETINASGLPFGLKVTVDDELNTGAFTAAGMDTLTFNGQNANATSADTAYFAVADGVSHALSVKESGYVNGGVTNNGGITAITTSDAAQVVVNLGGQTACTSAISGAGPHTCNGLQYNVKVTNVSSELDLDLPITGTGVNVTITGVSTTYNGNVAYIPTPTGSRDIVATAFGYVTTTNSSVTVDSTTAQVVKQFNSGDVGGLPYSIKATAYDELANQLTLDGSTGNMTISGYTTQYNSNTAYIPVNATGVKTITATVDGYVQATNTTVDPTNSAQKIVLFNNSGTADYRTDGLDYAVKVTSVTDELGGTLSTVTVETGDSYGTSCTENSGAWYCAVPLNNTGVNIRATKDGYVQDTDDTWTDRTAHTDPQLTPTVTGVQFAHKINVTREVDGAQLTGATVTAGVNTVSCTENGNWYYCPVLLADDNLTSYTVELDGYVTKTGTLANRTLNADAQQTYAASNVQFSHKIVVDDELGNSLTGATVSAGTTPQNCIENSTTGDYFCNVTLANDGSAAINVTKDGFVTNTDNVTVDRATNATAQVVVDVTTVQYAYKVNNVFDELGNALTGVTVATGDAYGTICTESSGSWYCAVPLDNTTLDIYAAKAGYVTDITDNFTTDRTAHSDAQQTQNVTDMYFNVKAIGVQDELGNDLTIDGSAVNVTVNGVTTNYTGGVAYLPVPTGTVTVTADADGYISDSNTTVKANSTDGQQTVLFGTGAVADYITPGLDFSVLVVGIYDELGNQLTIDGSSVNATVTATTTNYTGGYAYIPASDGVVTVTASADGYVTANNASVLANSSDMQMTVVFVTGGQANYTTDGLDFNVKVLGVEDELGNALTLDGTTAIATIPTYTTNYTGGVAYIPASTGTVTVTAASAGYVTDSNATVAADSSTQKTVNFGSGAANYRNDGLNYTVKVLEVEDELGSTIPLDGTTATAVVTGYTTNYTGGIAYIPVNTTSAATVYAIAPGYVTDSNTTVNPNSTTGQVTERFGSGTADYVNDGLDFNIKVLGAYDELANQLTLDGSDTSAVVAGFTTAYDSGYAYINATTGTVTVTAFKTGYINATNSSVLANSTSGQVTVLFNTTGTATYRSDGLDYMIRAEVYNELGQQLTTDGTIAAIEVANNVAIKYDNNYAYIAVANGTHSVNASATGYINATVSASTDPTVQTTVKFNETAGGADYSTGGLDASVKVVLDDEVSQSSITGATIVLTDAAATTFTAIDGSTNDLDATEDGVIYWALDASSINTKVNNILVNHTNYVNWVDAVTDPVPDTATQTLITSANKFPLKVTVQDNNGDALTGVTLTANDDGTETSSTVTYSASGVYYMALNTSLFDNIQIVMEKAGYQTWKHPTDNNLAGNYLSIDQTTQQTGNSPYKLIEGTTSSSGMNFSEYLGNTWNSFFLPRVVLEDISSLSSNYTVANVLSSISGNYAILYYYDDSDWTSYVEGRGVNDLTIFNDTVSNPYWIKMTTADTIEIA